MKTLVHPPYEQEFQLNQFSEEVGEANGDVKVSDEAELAISE